MKCTHVTLIKSIGVVALACLSACTSPSSSPVPNNNPSTSIIPDTSGTQHVYYTYLKLNGVEKVMRDDKMSFSVCSKTLSLTIDSAKLVMPVDSVTLGKHILGFESVLYSVGGQSRQLSTGSITFTNVNQDVVSANFEISGKAPNGKDPVAITEGQFVMKAGSAGLGSGTDQRPIVGNILDALDGNATRPYSANAGTAIRTSVGQLNLEFRTLDCTLIQIQIPGGTPGTYDFSKHQIFGIYENRLGQTYMIHNGILHLNAADASATGTLDFSISENGENIQFSNSNFSVAVK